MLIVGCDFHTRFQRIAVRGLSRGRLASELLRPPVPQRTAATNLAIRVGNNPVPDYRPANLKPSAVLLSRELIVEIAWECGCGFFSAGPRADFLS